MTCMHVNNTIPRGRAIRELGLRRTDLIITTKIFWGVGRKGPNDGGLSRKQCVWFLAPFARTRFMWYG